jgi:lipopolysaccharide transport system permease protein
MEKENWTQVIEYKRKLFDINIREVIRYRDLVYLLVKRDFVLQYKQTILGPIWLVIQPLFQTIVYTLIFGNLAKIGTDGIPFILFYYSGSMLWTLFVNCFNDVSNIFITNADLFGKIYFPRLVEPIHCVFSNFLKIIVQFALFIAIYVYYIITGSQITLSLAIIAFPFIFIWLAAIAMGMGIIVSSLTTKYRDLRMLVTFAISLGMYVTPVVYPLSQIPERFSWICYANPISAPIELFRVCFFGVGSVNSAMIICSLVLTVLILFFGLMLFNQNERNFVDVI